jgi:hypothetical protein
MCLEGLADAIVLAVTQLPQRVGQFVRLHKNSVALSRQLSAISQSRDSVNF